MKLARKHIFVQGSIQPAMHFIAGSFILHSLPLTTMHPLPHERALSSHWAAPLLFPVWVAQWGGQPGGGARNWGFDFLQFLLGEEPACTTIGKLCGPDAPSEEGTD